MSAIDNDAAAKPMDELRFGFGENWAEFVKTTYSEEIVEISRKHLLNFLKCDTLENKTFLDIGSGSGLHSLAAWRSGAKRVVSFDYDPNSVETTQKIHQMSGEPDNWQVMQGSILDTTLAQSLPKFDVVYSWGVLHHTGKMWQAIRNASEFIGDDGVFYIALYSKDQYVDPPYHYWLDIKKQYNLSGSFKKRIMEVKYSSKKFRNLIRKGNNPFKFLKEYKKNRGMSYWYDVRDWLGGYPMEFAGNKETEFFARSELSLELINMKAGEGNTEFLFRRIGANNYWDALVDGHARHEIAGPFQHVEGHAWRGKLSTTDIGDPKRLMLYENESPIGWPVERTKRIIKWGKGRYRIEDGDLLFSTTDNSDPNQAETKLSYRTNFL